MDDIQDCPVVSIGSATGGAGAGADVGAGTATSFGLILVAPALQLPLKSVEMDERRKNLPAGFVGCLASSGTGMVSFSSSSALLLEWTERDQLSSCDDRLKFSSDELLRNSLAVVTCTNPG
eukprot:scaffold779_cov165-Amphora_coffeaeformis.AAC.12